MIRFKKNIFGFLKRFGDFFISLGKKIFDYFPFFRDFYHFILAFLGNIIFRFPSKKIKIIGITGTNGKTTTLELTKRIFEEAGFKTASVSSIKFSIGEKEWENTLRMTLPGRLKVQKFLREAVDSDCKYAIFEVTSEGIKQHRHKFIDFYLALLTNLTPEHIEAHGGFENYKKTKGKLFEAAKEFHIVNLDDKHFDYFLTFGAKQKIGYRKQKTTGDKKLTIKQEGLKVIEAKECKVYPSGVSFSIDNIRFNLNLLGEFNIYNALAAISIGLSQKIDLETCKRALEKTKGMPGRMERVILEPFMVFVDYAFTPNAQRQVYQTIKRDFAKKKLICVLGAAGGGRDKWKRPVLGKIAAEHCDEVILTNEDPYDENPIEIINQIAQGAGDKARKILERREAIKKALEVAEKEDVVIITGKGCEPSICLAGGKRIPWDDRKVVREEFEKIRIKN